MKDYNFIIDSHCHLDLMAKKQVNIDDIVENALKQNVKILQTICTKISEFNEIYQYTQKYKNVFASIGNHPCNVQDEKPVKADEIIKICKSHNKVIGIGETGLDYYHDSSFKDLQIASLLEHIEASRITNLPLIIHNRNSDEDMIDILSREMKRGEFKALLHCFSSSKELALKALDLGVYISISGIVTFKNASELQDMVKDFPLERLLIETDSPYLAPTPYRGKINQPAYTREVGEFLAKLKGISSEEVFLRTSKNFIDLFSLDIEC